MLRVPFGERNFGQPGHGCENSAETGGALLTATGTTNPDLVVLTSSGELPSVLTAFLQGDANVVAGVLFGDGVRCTGGNLKRLSFKNAIGGAASYPETGEISITQRSANLGDVIPPGGVRYYQTYYRDPTTEFCSPPPGSNFNVTNGLRITW